MYRAMSKRLHIARGKLTQRELGQLLGVSRSYVGNVEQGRTKPSIGYLVGVARICRVSLDWLILGIGEADDTTVQVLSGDLELRAMVRYLRELWMMGDSTHREEIRRHFSSAFPEYESKESVYPLKVSEGEG